MFNGLEHMIPPKMEFQGMYMAEVIDNVDPINNTSGRVRLRVFPMMTGLEEAVLPWAIPAFGLFEGGSADAGAFTVPAKNSKVWVFFVAGDVRSPVYFAAAVGMMDGPTGATPEKKIWKTRSGHIITIDDTSGNEMVEVKSKGGGVITMKQDGDVKITGAAKVFLGPKCEVGSAPLGKCVTELTMPACFFSGAPLPGTDKLQAES